MAFTRVNANYIVVNSNTGYHIEEIFEEDEIGHETAVAGIIYENLGIDIINISLGVTYLQGCDLLKFNIISIFDDAKKGNVGFVAT